MLSDITVGLADRMQGGKKQMKYRNIIWTMTISLYMVSLSHVADINEDLNIIMHKDYILIT